MNKIKKIILVATIISLSIFITACPFLDDDINNYSFMTIEEFLSYINEQNFGTSFTVKDSSETIGKNYKYLTLYLEAEDLPGKTVKAYQYFGMDSFEREIEETSVYPDEDSRMRVFYVSESRYIDYYFVKYQAELSSLFENLYASLLEGLEKNKDYLLAIKPNIESFPIDSDEYYSSETSRYSSAEELFKNGSFITFLLINKEFTTLVERDFNSFAYSLMNDLEEESTAKAYFYYSTKYSVEDVTIYKLTSDSFYTISDLEDSSVNKNYIYF
ncbi:MAG: hypothetical protein K5829_15510 [Treponema sp.]|nr:hypothetical protein [Treponema sp.]